MTTSKTNKLTDESLTEDNYFSAEMQMYFMGASQFKSFHKCEAAGLAELRGPQKEPTTDMLIGSYIDAYFTGDVEQFKETHSSIFKRDGNLKSEFVKADNVIARIEKDEKMMKYLSGEPQVIMTGEIESVPFKIKMDSYHPGKAIVDLKIMKGLGKEWSDKLGERVPFVEFWGYDIQGAIYQEIVRQNTGQQLPFILACATKQTSPRLALLDIQQDQLNYCLDLVRSWAPHYNMIKQGREEPDACRDCDYCAATLPVTGVVDYRIL